MYWIRFVMGIAAASSCLGNAANSKPLNQALADTGKEVAIRTSDTDSAMDGGSIVNDLRFSDGRLMTLVMRFPFDLATAKLKHPEIEFVVFVPGNWAQREVIAKGSPAERRLIELLEMLVARTDSQSEKKNPTSLIVHLRLDRHKKFPSRSSGWWDFTGRP